MKFSIGQLALASCAAAAPAALERRVVDNDIDILNFALTLEHLEDAFYKEGLSKFKAADFTKAGYEPRVRFNVAEISADESTHVTFLTSAIKAANGTAVKACTYDFGLTDVDSFMDTASILEGVGVTAYLGAAALISDKSYLTPAASILTIEARHHSYIRDNHQPGPRSPFPQPFDVPQTINEVFTLASAFITKCPKNPTLPASAYPALTAMSKGVVRAKDVVTFAYPAKTKLTSPVYASFALVTGPVFTPASLIKGSNKVNITIPSGVYGQSYVVLTTAKSVTDTTIVAGPGIIEIQAPYTFGGFPK